jgi:hypothetical protein
MMSSSKEDEDDYAKAQPDFILRVSNRLLPYFGIP